jgi:MoxR-like ATPase
MPFRPKTPIINIETNLSHRIIGQREAIAEISQVLRSSFSGFLRDPNKPMSVLLLKGPTGVGKTETAKALADLLIPDNNYVVYNPKTKKNQAFPATKITSLHMEGFKEEHSVHSLTGSPNSYVGYGDKTNLQKDMGQCPIRVVLLDEIEKAHPDVIQQFMHAFDEGAFQMQGSGKPLDFKNTIFILTTNEPNPEKTLPPELINRMDGIIEYKKLSVSELREVLNLKLEPIQNRLFEAHNIHLKIDDKALDAFAEFAWKNQGSKGTHKAYGFAQAVNAMNEPSAPQNGRIALKTPGSGPRALQRMLEKAMDPLATFLAQKSNNIFYSNGTEVVVHDLLDFEANIIRDNESHVITANNARNPADTKRSRPGPRNRVRGA